MMGFYHGKQRHQQKIFLSTIIRVIVIVTWREKEFATKFFMYVVFLWTTVILVLFFLASSDPLPTCFCGSWMKSSTLACRSVACTSVACRSDLFFFSCRRSTSHKALSQPFSNSLRDSVVAYPAFSSKRKGPGEQGAAGYCPKILLLNRAKVVLCPFHRSHGKICTRNRWDFWMISGGPFLSRPLCFTADACSDRGPGQQTSCMSLVGRRFAFTRIDSFGKILLSAPNAHPLKSANFILFVVSPSVTSGGVRRGWFGVFGARDSGPHDRALSVPRHCLDA